MSKPTDNEPEGSRRHDLTPHTLPSPFPQWFEDDSDSHLDVTAPPGGVRSPESRSRYLHHPVFSMIAAVGCRHDFHTRLDDSSESDGDLDEPHARRRPSPFAGSTASKENRLSQSSADLAERGRSTQRQSESQIHGLGLGGRRLGKSTPSAESSSPNHRSSLLAAFPVRSRSATPRAIPVLSRMVEAQARFAIDRYSQEPYTHEPENEKTDEKEASRPSSSSLSSRLMEIFGFEKPEKVIVEYACSLLQSMLLHGYMYVTEGHVCFYAYLPKKSTGTIRSGHISKRGNRNPRYKRYWFSLKGDVLSYYKDSSRLYFPHGHVDLRYGISASMTGQKDKDNKDAKDFQVTTDQGTFHFRADSTTSAREWVKALQKVIFRTHNDGESVKISFPIENIIDIDESPIVDFAETFKIRVVEPGELYGIDEVRTSKNL